jgi:hypothetical protein
MMLLIMFALPTASAVSETRGNDITRGPKVGWSTFLRGGYVHQFDAEIDSGGSFSVDRLVIQAGLTHATDYRRSISLALGYSFYGYDFSGESGLASLCPWKKIDSFRVSTPARWGFNKQWTVFVIPTLRFVGESGANLEDAASGGGFAGFSYRFGGRLTIGPGIGVITQIADNASVFPVLVINWKITDRLSLETGRGLGATLGPGLTLNWKASNKWNFSLGGRFERLRFRLDKESVAPKGVGEDSAFPLFGGVVYSFSPRSSASLVGGVELDGQLRLEDERGNRIAEENHDPAGFAGFTFRFRF